MQGRFKRDGGAAGGDPEQRGGTDHGPSPRRTNETAEAGTTGAQPSAGPLRGTGTGPKHGSRIAMRNWRISTRLVSLLALPVVAATSLGALRIQSSLDNVTQLGNVQTLTDLTEQATKLAAALQEERDSSAGPLSGKNRNTGNDTVIAKREATERAKTAFIAASNNGIPQDLTGVSASLVAINKQLGTLKDIRANAYTDENYISQTVSEYDDLITQLLGLSEEMAQASGNSDMIKSTRALAAFSAAKEYDSIQRAMISAALANGNNLQPNDWRYLDGVHSAEATTLNQFRQIYGEAATTELLSPLDAAKNDTIQAVDEQQDRVAATEEGIKNITGSYLDWDDNARTKLETMKKIEAQLLNDMTQQGLKLQNAASQEAYLNGAIILLVLGISVVGAFVVARSMIRSLRRLQEGALDVAQKRLPELVKHLSESDPQDVDTSVESIGITSRDEIGQVARAFDEVHREAVRLAAEQALLRGNVNAMFTNLSRRSQGLIQRQLSLISELESREADPDQLSSLFKLDHLATRMRRNGENLLVLAGEEPGRRWTRPVPLVDVLRAAASEVEQYERIELTSVPGAEVTGRIVNDLVHLLAELLENATSFSSPQTKVRVTGHALPDGRVLIEIHDTGIGLSPEDLADINERLANPPTVDVSVSRRMGLFVVGRLSLRHGIRIQLRPSDSGGTTALVMLPVDVTQGGGKVKPGAAGRGQQPGMPGGPGGPVAAGLGAGPGNGQVGRPPQRGQVPASEPRPALNSGPGGPGSPQGRPAGSRPAPAPGGPGGRHAPQRTNPSWAESGQDNGRTAPQPPQQPQQPQRGGNAPQPASAAADRARGHEDVESTQAFERPDFDSLPHTGPQRGSGSGPRPAPAAMPAPAAQSGPAPVADFGTVPQGRPQQGGQGQGGFTRSDVFQQPGTGGRPAPAPTPMPQAPAPAPAPQQQRPQPNRGAEPQLPPVAEPMALPPAPMRGDERSPIFEALESDWFRSGRVERMQQVHVESGPTAPAPQQQPSAPVQPQPRPNQAARPQQAPPQRTRAEQPPQPQPTQQAQPQQHTPPPRQQQPLQRPGTSAPQYQNQNQNGQPNNQQQYQPTQPPRRETPAWRPTPNDEVWQRAEQVREPSAGGITPSGLPRRVPRANLVPGGAAPQQAPQGGPQVSRAPDDVRGRLTNLRRGIQQGRQATPGPGDRAPDSQWGGNTHQQER
ncbi:nitrate- and nitrite sensing domain-containing protein [Streptomyces sp. NPDC059373]